MKDLQPRCQNYLQAPPLEISRPRLTDFVENETLRTLLFYIFVLTTSKGAHNIALLYQITDQYPDIFRRNTFFIIHDRIFISSFMTSSIRNNANDDLCSLLGQIFFSKKIPKL